MQSSPALGDTVSNSVSFSGLAAESAGGVALKPLCFFILGATGRTGLPFSVTIARAWSLRNELCPKRVEAACGVASHPHLRTFTGALHDADKITTALRESAPDVVYVMLASEKAPHTAVSLGTHNVLRALETLRGLVRAQIRRNAAHKYRRLGPRPDSSLRHQFFRSHVRPCAHHVVLVESQCRLQQAIDRGKGSERCRTCSANPGPAGDTYQRQEAKRLPIGGGQVL